AYPINTRSDNNVLKFFTVLPKLLGTRLSFGNVSSKRTKITINSRNPTTLKVAKIPFHSVNANTIPPKIGANIGAKLLMSMSVAKNFVNARPLNESRTIAREITIPAEAANPCKNRAAINAVIVGENIQMADAIPYPINENMSGFFRPYTSLIGPNTSCPIPIPNKQAVKLTCTSDAVVSNDSAIVGNDGKYMSIVNGPIAANKPSKTAKRNRLNPVNAFINLTTFLCKTS